MKYSFEAAIIQLNEESVADEPGGFIRFIVDAQLPKKLSDLINSKGFDSIHTLDLHEGNTTTDKYIRELSIKENRVLISKDDDFLRSYLLLKRPAKLILIKTGNIPNSELMEIFQKGLILIVALIQKHSLLEITRQEIIAHN